MKKKKTTNGVGEQAGLQEVKQFLNWERGCFDVQTREAALLKDLLLEDRDIPSLRATGEKDGGGSDRVSARLQNGICRRKKEENKVSQSAKNPSPYAVLSQWRWIKSTKYVSGQSNKHEVSILFHS